MVKKALASLHDLNRTGSLVAALILVTIAMFGMLVMDGSKQSSAMQYVPVTSQLFARHETGSQLPALLTTKDRNLYQDIFRAQQEQKWKEADWMAKQLTSKHLMGHVLGERYLHPSYNSSADELENWLKQYSDHPQAHRIYALAIKKNPQLKLTPIHKKRALEGYGDDSGLASWMAKSSTTEEWNNAIDAWRRQDNVQAARLFSTLSSQKDLHPWKKSASAFWAWRAYDSLGNKKQADRYLRMAANYPRTFYGVLARQKLGHSLALDNAPEALTDTDVLELMGEQAIRRIISLARVGATDLADAEIRQIFPSANTEEKYRLLTIANELGLASAQIAMARQLATQDQRLDFARYPVPAWQPHTGFRIDPALIYAMARQESGFRNDAVSHAGATGVMQLMPQTASLMKKQVLKDKQNSPIGLKNNTEATANVTLGQGYIEHLLDVPLVENNLLYLLTAYNAGPGRLQQWKKDITYRNDPLLFIESIPFGETRSYVQQVMTNYWIYSEIIGTQTQSRQALLKNQWPDYKPLATPVAALNAAHAS